MSLTGMPFLLLVAFLALLFMVAAITETPFLRLPRIVKRFFFVVGTQVFTVLLALVALNNWGEFYGSWDDLFGNSTGKVRTITAEPGQQVTGLPTSFALTGWSHRDELSEDGGVFAVTVKGETTHISTNALVYLPPQYFQKAFAHNKFPVVETLAGYPGNVPELVDRLGYPTALLKTMKTGGVHPMILVMARPTVAPPRDTDCTDVAHGPATFSFFAKDLPAFIKKNLRVTDHEWGAIGHSTGGYCAAKLVMMAPQQFSTAVSMSGYFTPHEDSTTGDLYGGNAELAHENDLLWRLHNKPVPDVSLLATIGSEEHGDEGIKNNELFMKSVKSPMQAQLKIVDGGGHNFGTYEKVMPSAFAWLSDHIPWTEKLYL